MTLREPVYLATDLGVPPDAPYQPERIDWRLVETLPPAGGKHWLKVRDGRLLRVERVRLPAEKENPWKPGSMCVVRTDRRVIEGMGLPGGGHPSVIVEEFIEAVPAIEADYRAAQAADKAEAERKARRLNPPLVGIRIGRHVDELRAELARAGIVNRRGRWYAPRGRITDTLLDELRRYEVPLRDGPCHECKAIATRADAFGTALCEKDAAEEAR